jgi:hypothetical protein
MIYMRFTGINVYKLAVEKDRDSIFTTIRTIWKPGFSKLYKMTKFPARCKKVCCEDLLLKVS